MSYRDGWAGVPPRKDPISGELAPPLELESIAGAHYVPVSTVISDGHGHFVRVDTCNCTDGSYDWTPGADCPIHGEPPDWGTDG